MSLQIDLSSLLDNMRLKAAALGAALAFSQASTALPMNYADTNDISIQGMYPRPTLALEIVTPNRR